jgi:Tfp pilus assembly protein PilV
MPTAGEAGDTLIEVLISAVVIVLVVVATFTALNSANHVTSLDRARSQADALAQQDEDELRSEPIKKLSELSTTHEAYLQEVTKGGTHYTISSQARYISDKTATASCTSTTPSADYIATSSTVTWSSMGVSKPVVETGVVSPPPDAALIVQVTGASGEPVSNMVVQATGPSTISTETSSDGCAILAVSPGEYKLNVTKAGYVDQNGYENSDEDPISNSSFYVVAENTVKSSYEFAPAGGFEVSFSEPPITEGDTFAVFNSALTSLKAFGQIGKYGKPLWSTETNGTTVPSGKRLFPFTSKYIVYAGTCEADMPTRNGQASNPEFPVTANTMTPITVPVPPINVVVYEGANATSPVMTSGATGTIEDTGCDTTHTFTTTSEGKLPRPGMPYGKYSLCVTATVGGEPRRVIETVLNNNAAGVSVPIYLGTGEKQSICP